MGGPLDYEFVVSKSIKLLQGIIAFSLQTQSFGCLRPAICLRQRLIQGVWSENYDEVEAEFKQLPHINEKILSAIFARKHEVGTFLLFI